MNRHNLGKRIHSCWHVPKGTSFIKPPKWVLFATQITKQIQRIHCRSSSESHQATSYHFLPSLPRRSKLRRLKTSRSPSAERPKGSQKPTGGCTPNSPSRAFRRSALAFIGWRVCSGVAQNGLQEVQEPNDVPMSRLRGADVENPLRVLVEVLFMTRLHPFMQNSASKVY